MPKESRVDPNRLGSWNSPEEVAFRREQDTWVLYLMHHSKGQYNTGTHLVTFFIKDMLLQYHYASTDDVLQASGRASFLKCILDDFTPPTEVKWFEDGVILQVSWEEENRVFRVYIDEKAPTYPRGVCRSFVPVLLGKDVRIEEPSVRIPGMPAKQDG